MLIKHESHTARDDVAARIRAAEHFFSLEEVVLILVVQVAHTKASAIPRVIIFITNAHRTRGVFSLDILLTHELVHDVAASVEGEGIVTRDILTGSHTHAPNQAVNAV